MKEKLKKYIQQLKLHLDKMTHLDRVQSDDIVEMLTILIKMYDGIYKK